MAGRPKKSETNTKAKTTTKTKEVDVNKQLEEMQKQMELLLKNQAKLQEENKKLKEVKTEPEKETIVAINPNKRVKLVHMLQGGTTLKNQRSLIRFENFLQPRYARYEDVEDFRHGKYHKLFESAGVLVIGRENREALMLDTIYAELGISAKMYDEMLKLDAQALIAKLSTLPINLQITFSTYFIEQAKDENPDCVAISKWDALSKYFSDLYGKDINFSRMINE